MLDRKHAQKSNGYSLIEVLVTASLGAVIVMTAQQLLQWQKGAQHSSVSKARFMLNGQAVAEKFFSSLSNSVVEGVQNPERGCYVFPTQNGGSVGFRIRSYQLQHNNIYRQGIQALHHIFHYTDLNRQDHQYIHNLG
mgnify:CR=1 FL=1